MLKKIFVTGLIATSCLAFVLIISTLNAQETPEEIVAKLSLRQKIGQLFVVAAASNFTQPTEQLASSMAKCPYNMDPAYVESLIRDYYVGGVIFLYKSDPTTQMNLAKKFQTAAPVPLLIAQDSEWGLSMRLDIDPTKVVRYPRNMTLGAIADEQIIYNVANEIGKQCAAIGVHMNLAPVADVNNNKANPVIHDRSFGDDPQRVARLSQVFMRGLHDAGVLACAKHFPGHGDTNVDSHVDLPVIQHTRARLDAVELVPFKALAQSGIDGIMHAHLHIPELDPHMPSSLSYNIVTQLLKEELGYNGLSITDGLGMDAVMKKYSPGQLELAAFLAGNDILLCPLDVPRAVTLIEQAVKEGTVSEENLNARVLKVLRAKMSASQQQQKLNHSIIDTEAYLIRPEAYELQKQAYRAAITLVPQYDQVFLNKTTFDISHIVQIGKLPEDRFIQACQQANNKVFSYSNALPQAELDACIAAATKNDTTIIAVGQMNKFINQNFGIAENVPALVTRLHQMGKKVIVVLFGTPYSIELFKNADAIIVAYEDVPVAQEAVFDVLQGALNPIGILPVKV